MSDQRFLTTVKSTSLFTQQLLVLLNKEVKYKPLAFRLQLYLDTNLDKLEHALLQLLMINMSHANTLYKVANSGMAYFNLLQRHHQNILFNSNPVYHDTGAIVADLKMTEEEARVWAIYLNAIDTMQRVVFQNQIDETEAELILQKFMASIDNDDRFTEI